MTTVSPTGASPTKLDSALEQIGMDIVTGVLRPGSVMTLHELGERFAISRTVAREVMRALEQLGLVESSRRVGITVRPRSGWKAHHDLIIAWRLASETARLGQLSELAEMRLAIEPQAARFMAFRALPQHKEELLNAAAQIARASAHAAHFPEGVIEASHDFHAMLLVYSGNELFRSLSPSLLSDIAVRVRHGLTSPALPPEVLDSYRQLAEAIFHGNGPAAEELCRFLVHTTTATPRYATPPA